MSHDDRRHSLANTLDTLTDKNFITLTDTQFLVADDDEARAISRLIRTIGADEGPGVIQWYASRVPQTFIQGADLIAAL
jgi:hypothetical protein